eukprot:3516518-Rhodomonas_salina.1
MQLVSLRSSSGAGTQTEAVAILSFPRSARPPAALSPASPAFCILRLLHASKVSAMRRTFGDEGERERVRES